MNTHELRRGDIIFFIRHYPDDSSREPYVDHVAMYTGSSGEPYPYITHAISDEKRSMLCTTMLRDYGDQIDSKDDGTKYRVHFEVFRLRDAVLAEKAADKIVRWGKYSIPYDEKRLDRVIFQEEEVMNKPAVLLAKSRGLFQRLGLFNVVKYTARGDIPVRPRRNSLRRGLICTSAVVLAYQTEEMAPYVMPRENNEWVSDKYGKLSLLSTESEDKENLASQSKCPELMDRFLDYCHSLRSDTGIEPMYEKVVSSLTKLKSSFFSKIKHESCIPLYSKDLSCSALKLYLDQTPSLWEPLGQLTAPVITFSPEEKSKHHTAGDKVAQEINDRVRDIANEIGKCFGESFSDRQLIH